jgi:hypothetical protein
MKKLTAICFAALFLSACSNESNPQQPKPIPPPAPVAQQTAQPTAAAAKPRYFEDRIDKLTATVTAIDADKRILTLRGAEGNEVTFTVDPEVRNLAQVKVGDQVAVGYYESIAINVQKPSEAVNEVRAAADRAEAGAKPAGYAAQQTTLTATIEAIDRTVPSVTLRGPLGNVRTLKIRDPKKLDNVNVGDQVVITYTEALAISVDEVK